MKRIISVLGIISIILTGVVSAEERVSLWVNGNVVQTPGILRDDRTFVPIRFVAEELGAAVLWNEEENAVYIYDKPDEVLPEEKWLNENYDKMVESIIKEQQLQDGTLENEESGYFCYRTEGFNLTIFPATIKGNKLIVDVFGEGEPGGEYTYIMELWYYSLEDFSFGKICDGNTGRNFLPAYGVYYESEKHTDLCPGIGLEDDIILIDCYTLEKFSVPRGKVFAILGENIYFTKFDEKLYVKNVREENEKSFDLPKGINEMDSSYTDGKYIYFFTNRENEEVTVLDTQTFEYTKINVWSTRFPGLLRWTEEEKSVQIPEKKKPLVIYVNDRMIHDIPDAFILNDRTYVPVRFVAEALGAEVKWIDGENRVDISGNKTRPARYAFTDYNAGEIGKYN